MGTLTTSQRRTRGLLIWEFSMFPGDNVPTSAANGSLSTFVGVCEHTGIFYQGKNSLSNRCVTYRLPT